MELGTTLTVLVASKLGLPISTTHCITGATAGVGLTAGGRASDVNWRLVAVAFMSWMLTLPAAGLTAGLVFSFAAYSPKQSS